MDQAQSPIVDFHSHFVGPSLPLTTLKGLCGPQRTDQCQADRCRRIVSVARTGWHSRPDNQLAA